VQGREEVHVAFQFENYKGIDNLEDRA